MGREDNSCSDSIVAAGNKERPVSDGRAYISK